MKSPLPVNTRFSNFRFSIPSFRSPLSPKPANNGAQSLITGQPSGKTSPTDSSADSPVGADKDPNSVSVTVVDSDQAAVGTPRALPTAGSLSPLTPWHASFHRNAASVDQETAYLRRTSSLRYARLVLAVLLFAAGVSLTALESDILHHYNSTHLPSNFHLALWPTDVNLKPTLLALSTGTITTLLSLITIITSCIPSPNPRTTLQTTLFTALCLVITTLNLASIILSSAVSPAAIFTTFVSTGLTAPVSTKGSSSTTGLSVDGGGSTVKRETIQSFTCTISNTAKAFNADATKLQLPSLSDINLLVPSGFGKLCAESHASQAVVIALLCLGVIGLGLAGMSWMVQRQIGRLREEREAVSSRDGQIVPESLVGIPYEKSDVEG